MKFAQASFFLILLFIRTSTSASLLYDFTGKDAIFDGQTLVPILLSDIGTGLSTTMTVSSVGGELNSNAGDFGVDGTETGETNDFIDGLVEAIHLTFDSDIEINFLDLGGVGSDTTDGADVTFGSFGTVTLHTGISDFNGTSDIYTPSTPIFLASGESIQLTGSSSTSDFDLETIDITVIPEPSTFVLVALTGLAGFGMLRRKRM